jgi:hypothetical protein
VSVSPYSKSLILSDRDCLAQGVTRRVYQHPDYEDLLVKVMRPETIERKWGRFFHNGKFRRRAGKYVTYMRELREYLAVRANCDRHPPVLERVFGLAETDLGVGLVVEKLRGPDGKLAQRADDRVREAGLSEEFWEQFAVLKRTIDEFNIVFGNLAARNIVLAADEHKRERMVVVDGIGDKSLIPFASWSQWINRRNNDRLFRRLRRRLEYLAAERRGEPNLPSRTGRRIA